MRPPYRNGNRCPKASIISVMWRKSRLPSFTASIGATSQIERSTSVDISMWVWFGELYTIIGSGTAFATIA